MAAADRFTIDIEGRGGVLSTGFLGTPFSLDVLADVGRADLVYDLLLRTEFPSWGYMIAKGATTIWERWNGDVGDVAMNSFNHYALGAVAGFLFRRVAGIAPAAPGFASVALGPDLAGLDHAEGIVPTPHGDVEARLERAGASRGEPYTLCGAARCDDLVTVRALLDAGAPVDEPERGWTLATLRLQRAVGNPGEFADRGQTALAIAANRGHLDVCRVLLDAGADPRVRPHPSLPGFTLLTAAATGGDVELCRTLLARGLDVDGGFAVGTRRLGTNRPLCAAAMAGQVEAVRFLLEAGADASAHDARRDPGALYYARASAAPEGRKHAIFALLGADVAVESAVQIAQLARRRAGKPALTPVPPDVLDTVGTLLGQTGKPWKRRRAVSPRVPASTSASPARAAARA